MFRMLQPIFPYHLRQERVFVEGTFWLLEYGTRLKGECEEIEW